MFYSSIPQRSTTLEGRGVDEHGGGWRSRALTVLMPAWVSLAHVAQHNINHQNGPAIDFNVLMQRLPVTPMKCVRGFACGKDRLSCSS